MLTREEILPITNNLLQLDQQLRSTLARCAQGNTDAIVTAMLRDARHELAAIVLQLNRNAETANAANALHYD